MKKYNTHEKGAVALCDGPLAEEIIRMTKGFMVNGIFLTLLNRHWKAGNQNILCLGCSPIFQERNYFIREQKLKAVATVF
jgi:hypothetical protein